MQNQAAAWVPAKAGTHAKHLQGLRFLLPWIPAFAGMTVWYLCHTPFTRRVKGHLPASRCFAGHFRVEPVSTAVFRFMSFPRSAGSASMRPIETDLAVIPYVRAATSDFAKSKQSS